MNIPSISQNTSPTEAQPPPIPCQAMQTSSLEGGCPIPATWRFTTYSGAFPTFLCDKHADAWRAPDFMAEALEAGAMLATHLSEVEPAVEHWCSSPDDPHAWSRADREARQRGDGWTQ